MSLRPLIAAHSAANFESLTLRCNALKMGTGQGRSFDGDLTGGTWRRLVLTAVSGLFDGTLTGGGGRRPNLTYPPPLPVV